MDILSASPRRALTVLGVFLMLALVIGWALLGRHTNRDLRRHGLQPLPDSAAIHGQEQGGLFAEWLFVSATLNAEDYRAYKNAISAECDHTYALPGMATILIEGKREPDTEPSRKTFFKEKVNGRYLPWWTIELIAKGSIAVKELGHERRYRIYFDDERLTVLIY